MRTLTIIIVAFNITLAAPWGVQILWARERMGIGDVGFGLLLTTTAVGGLIGTMAYGIVSRRFSGETIMKVALTLEVAMHLTMATVTWRPAAFVWMFVFGVYSFMWGTLGATIRQRAVPMELQGRVGSVSMLGSMLGLLLGTPLGGVLAQWWGITAPSWFAFLGAGATLVVLWPQLRHVAHAGEVRAEANAENPHSAEV